MTTTTTTDVTCSCGWESGQPAELQERDAQYHADTTGHVVKIEARAVRLVQPTTRRDPNSPAK